MLMEPCTHGLRVNARKVCPCSLYWLDAVSLLRRFTRLESISDSRQTLAVLSHGLSE
jgi:hypothetical protein